MSNQSAIPATTGNKKWNTGDTVFTADVYWTNNGMLKKTPVAQKRIVGEIYKNYCGNGLRYGLRKPDLEYGMAFRPESIFETEAEAKAEVIRQVRARHDELAAMLAHLES